MSSQPEPPSDPTFRRYTSAQAAAYAHGRGTYPPALYDLILSHHIQTGGKTTTLLDIGTGPGTALRSLALSFTHAHGLDPSPAMISTARSLGGSTASGAPIRFDVSTAEELGANVAGIEDGTVDMITAATAAHWFDMPSFWRRAAQLLRPGGTVALWSGSSLYVHPAMPNAGKIQAILRHLEDEVLAPYHIKGNQIAKGGYVDLGLPWEVEPVVGAFEKGSFVRRQWNRDGRLEAGEEDFFMGREGMELGELERGLGTASAVTRWREAHPERAGGEEDAVRVAVREVEGVLREGGWDGSERLRGGVAGVLLMVKSVLTNSTTALS